MTFRLERIFSEIPESETFADVGCDHGYIAKAMIKSGKCKRAVISDVSAKCLKKAETLLKDEISSGIVKSVVSDGFSKVEKVDCALIAGLGGEEILHIIKNAKDLPDKLVLQPMKNAEKVREYSVKLGYKIIKDFVFKADGVYYTLIVLKKGEDFLTPEEIIFGRTNLTEKPKDFSDMLKEEIAKLKEYASRKNVNEKSKTELLNKAERLSKYV